MRTRTVSTLVFLAVCGAVPAALAQDDALSVYQEPILPDPVQNNGVHFAPGVATAGTANPGQTLNSLKLDTVCKPANSCAMPPPALQDIPLPRPLPRQARISHDGKSSVPSQIASARP